MDKTDFAELMQTQAQLMETSNSSFIDKLGLLMASSNTIDKKVRCVLSLLSYMA
jgi:hypothetical protein